jgi:hypothetical protein
MGQRAARLARAPSLGYVRRSGAFTKLGVEMSFETDWCLSSEIEAFRQHVRETEPFKKWFDAALDLNRLGFDMLRIAPTAPSDRPQLALNTLFLRVHQSLQSVLILAERGLVADARVVLRTAVECVIAITALANDASFFEQMMDAHRYSVRKRAREYINNVAGGFSPDEIAQMEEQIAQVDEYEDSKGAKLADIKWYAVAMQHCPIVYHFFYRHLSSDGTHATLDTLDGLKPAPNTDGLDDVLVMANLVFLWSAKPYAETNGLADFSRQIEDRFGELIDAANRQRRNAAVDG